MVALLKMPFRLAAAASAHGPAGGAGGAGGSPDDRSDDRHDDRRMFPRRECRARAEGRRLDHSIPALRHPRLALTLRDLSVGGLSAISPAPVAVGEQLSVALPPRGGHGGWDARGRVIRCEPAALGFRIALQFDAVPLAA